MYFRILLFLWFLNYSSAQDDCGFTKSVAVGDTVALDSPNFPDRYSPGQQCRWIMSCPRGYNCRLDCPEIRLPKGDSSCSMDILLVSRTGDPQLTGADAYCNVTALSVTSINQRISIGLITSRSSSGGRFSCQMTAVAAVPNTTCSCGYRKQNRIVGGEETEVNEYKMMVGLADVRTSKVKCGAVFIKKQHVLSTASCVRNLSAVDSIVLIGEHDVTIGTDTPATQALGVASFTIYPNYSSVNNNNDIAIIKLVKEIQFNEFVLPVCLPFLQRNNDFAGSKVTVVGWGTTEYGGSPSNVPRKVELDVLQQRTCRSRGANVTNRQMCTFTPGKDACQGDAGGPLLWTNPTNGLLYLVGIVSSGQNCASNIPGINTRVTPFLDWIVANTQQELYCIK